jgi:release factor glutamine methyltransferase
VTLDEAARLLAAAGLESPRAEARILLAHALGVTRDETLSPRLSLTVQQAEAFAAMVTRRAAREPSAYITGHKEFWSLDFAVGPGVLVPRPETETLIEEALRLVPDRNAPSRIADLGTGSGALLLAALSEFPNAAGIGFESSPQAFAWAQRNAARLAPDRAEIRLQTWDRAEGPFDLIFSNPPYIPAREIDVLEPEVSVHEPRAALDGGPGGLDAYRDLAGLLPRLLAPAGFAILEIGAGQRVESLFAGTGLKTLGTAPDLAGIPRALALQKA